MEYPSNRWPEMDEHQEVHMPAASIGFAASARKGKKSVDFKPTRKQINTAMRRIVCTLNKYDGATPVRSLNDAIDLFCKEVYNRGGELGTYEGRQFKTTIQTALHELMENDHVRLEDRSVLLTSKAKKHYGSHLGRRRKHHQKYPTNRSMTAFA